MSAQRTFTLSLFTSLLAVTALARADVKLASPFTDHMVLQQSARVPIWGTADAGETVHITFNDKTAAATAGPDGKWKAELNDLGAGGPFEMTVSGNNALTLHDVLVGEVWLCSGQSNMTMPLRECSDATAEIAAADHPTIRLFTVPAEGSLEPRDLIKNAAWKACSPQTIPGFSGAAYFFGRELSKELNVPIGLVHSSYGGTPAEAWTSLEALQAVPGLKYLPDAQLPLMRTADADRAAFPAKLLEWEKANNVAEPENAGLKDGWAGVDCDTSDWKKVTLGFTFDRGLGVKSGGAFWFRKDVDLPETAAGKPFRLTLGWLAEQYQVVYFNGEKVGDFGHTPPDYYTGSRAMEVPGKLVKAGRNVIAVRFVSHTEKGGFFIPGRLMSLPVADPKSVNSEWLEKTEALFPPLTPEALASRPVLNRQLMRETSTSLYNAMIHPLIPFAIKGAIWYQGENNGQRAFEYRTLLPTMIRDWRTRFGEGDFPFYIQQLANNGEASSAPAASDWAELREAQWLASQSEKNAGIACAIDIGSALTIHPKNKQEIGRRLALLALEHSYGKPVESSGPVFDTMKIDGDSVRLTFKHADALRAADSKPLARFEIAGADQKFVWADAQIDGNSVIVKAKAIAVPAAVRYAWATNPAGANLVNAAGLPAFPFRTDDWPASTTEVKWKP